MTLHLTELQNRLTRAQDMCVAALAALEAGDTDTAQRLMHQASALCAMAVWSADKSSGMSQPMALMTSQNTVEWYTPVWVLELARQVLGAIDLDPASSVQANETVQATRYYTRDDDGYNKPWSGRVWLNPPFDATDRWARRLEAAYVDGDVSEALFLCNSAPGYNWYESLVDTWPAIQFRKRMAFVRADGLSNKDKQGLAKKSQTIVYFGPNVTRFEAVFCPHGRRLHTPHAPPKCLFEEEAA